LAEVANANLNGVSRQRVPQNGGGNVIHPAWLRLMRYCSDLGHGEIEKLKIQDGLPMAAEVTTKKVKFSP
jgi:hypothetical protein